MAASVSCRVRAGGASASGPRRCCVMGDEGFSRRSARPHPVRAAGSHKSNVTPPPGVLEWERNQELVTELHGKAGSAGSRPRCAVCALGHWCGNSVRHGTRGMLGHFHGDLHARHAALDGVAPAPGRALQVLPETHVLRLVRGGRCAGRQAGLSRMRTDWHEQLRVAMVPRNAQG